LDQPSGKPTAPSEIEERNDEEEMRAARKATQTAKEALNTGQVLTGRPSNKRRSSWHGHLARGTPSHKRRSSWHGHLARGMPSHKRRSSWHGHLARGMPSHKRRSSWHGHLARGMPSHKRRSSWHGHLARAYCITQRRDVLARGPCTVSLRPLSKGTAVLRFAADSPSFQGSALERRSHRGSASTPLPSGRFMIAGNTLC